MNTVYRVHNHLLGSSHLFASEEDASRAADLTNKECKGSGCAVEKIACWTSQEYEESRIYRRYVEVQAGTYKVLRVNDEFVKYGNDSLGEGTYFDDIFLNMRSEDVIMVAIVSKKPTVPEDVKRTASAAAKFFYEMRVGSHNENP